MNKEIKKSIIKMYEPLKEQDLVYYEELQKIIDYIWELEHKIDKIKKYIEDNGIDEEMVECCDRYDINGIEIYKLLEEIE